MKRLIIAAALCVAALSGCNLSAVNPPGNTAGSTLSDQVVLKSTTALSLAELAFTSAEQGATAALKSGHLSKTDAANLGTIVIEARGYRDQARAAVAAGQDASAILGNLSTALTKIATLNAKGA